MSAPSSKKSVKRTAQYRTWFETLVDNSAKVIVTARIERIQHGLYGDVQPCGAGVSELRIDFGPGYRVYFTETLDNTIILLLTGGDKSTQKKDIKAAKNMLEELKTQHEAARALKDALLKVTGTKPRSK